ncbi:MAG: hypothetical protein HQK92_11125 [Nitrospirae bacterium]|nr:hypothetical protein [Nitrospirota bacterium]
MKKATLAVMLVVVMLGLVAVAYAEEDWHGGIHKRVKQAKERIEHGIKDRSLTEQEAKRLHKEFDRVIDEINRMKADGKLTPHEKERINHDLDKLDNDISKLKHNDEHRDRH